MSDYTISIAAKGGGGPSIEAAVRLTEEGLEITELRILTGHSGDLIPKELLNIDIAPTALAAMRILQPDQLLTANNSRSTRDPRESTASRRKPAKPNDRQPTGNTRGGGQPPSDLGAVYWRLGNIPKVANHYKVDKHTARKWINELLRKSNSPNAWQSPGTSKKR